MLHGDVLGERTRLTPEKTALVCVPGGQRFTYRELDERAAASRNRWALTTSTSAHTRSGRSKSDSTTISCRVDAGACGNTTMKSTSLSGRASPRAREPNRMIVAWGRAAWSRSAAC